MQENLNQDINETAQKQFLNKVSNLFYTLNF